MKTKIELISKIKNCRIELSGLFPTISQGELLDWIENNKNDDGEIMNITVIQQKKIDEYREAYYEYISIKEKERITTAEKELLIGVTPDII